MSDKATQTLFDNLTNEELFVLYRETGRIDYKQEIAMRYLYIVKSVALQMRNVYIGFEQVEDIINEGVITLMKAVDKYDIGQNVKFETFISKRIRGMVIDIARKQDWVPRTMRKNFKNITEASMNFYMENGREPTAEEICSILSLEREKYDETMSKSGVFNILSLDMAIEEVDEQRRAVQIVSDDVKEQPEESFMEGELKNILAEGIKQLKEKEQLVISLYYVEEISMKEIASILKVSEPRVSQIHSGAVMKLRNFIGNSSVKKEERNVSRIL